MTPTDAAHAQARDTAEQAARRNTERADDWDTHVEQRDERMGVGGRSVGMWDGVDLSAVKLLIDHQSAVKLLIDHQRLDSGSCLCGWGVDTGNLGRSHSLHIWRELQAAGIATGHP